MKQEDLETMIKLADNAFDCSNKFTKRCIHWLAGHVFIGFIIVFTWLVILTIKIF